ncbi:DUF2637 domain-containing protein [Yinghuangia seranimata]|uniref:DUF2637 domain-containing protein n=1 Tax=Yinghuangia seranimata TaxID=408067 RepID=UPI00248BF888|nr:DUF2637 domain-containing protein [Yinghuangia seranimata]MDI2128744.1 DUF2637 domain-containing protein [Yinghuangia seranimata]
MTARLRRVRFDPLLVQAAIAGALSFSHLHDIAQAAGQSGWQAWAYPVSVDLLMVAAWRRLLAHRTPGAWFWFVVALAASLGANVATAGLLDLHHPPAWLRLIVAGWPALAFLGGTLLVHRPAPPPAEAPAYVERSTPVEVFASVDDVEESAPDIAGEPPALTAPPEPADAPPDPAPAVPAALVAHARRIADQHEQATGQPIAADVLRARLGVPAPLLAQITAQLGTA